MEEKENFISLAAVADSRISFFASYSHRRLNIQVAHPPPTSPRVCVAVCRLLPDAVSERRSHLFNSLLLLLLLPISRAKSSVCVRCMKERREMDRKREKEEEPLEDARKGKTV